MIRKRDPTHRAASTVDSDTIAYLSITIKIIQLIHETHYSNLRKSAKELSTQKSEDENQLHTCESKQHPQDYLKGCLRHAMHQELLCSPYADNTSND